MPSFPREGFAVGRFAGRQAGVCVVFMRVVNMAYSEKVCPTLFPPRGHPPSGAAPYLFYKPVSLNIIIVVSFLFFHPSIRSHDLRSCSVGIVIRTAGVPFSKGLLFEIRLCFPWPFFFPGFPCEASPIICPKCCLERLKFSCNNEIRCVYIRLDCLLFLLSLSS